MPRVTINKKRYMLQDLYEWIEGRRARFDMTQADLGKLIGISQPSMHDRLEKLKEGKDVFKHIDLAIIFKRFEATDEEILRFMKL